MGSLSAASEASRLEARSPRPAACALEHDRAALRLAKDELLDGDIPPPLAGVSAELQANLTRAAARATDEEESEPTLVAVS